MCHWVRDEGFERERASGAVPPKEIFSPRPRRLVGAIAAVAAVAVAALLLLLPAPTPAESTAAAVPATPPTAVPTSVVEQTASGMDDGVPVASTKRASGGNCEHGF